MGWTIGIPSLKLNNVGQKSKHCGDFRSVAAEALGEREGRDSDIDREKSELNIYEGFRTAEELTSYSEEHCEQLRDKSGRKLRSDAVRMCATIIKPPAAYMATLSEEHQKQFLNDAKDCLASIVGVDNIKSTAMHFDELGAHLHVFWEPMTRDGRLCAKEVHNLQFFGKLNKEMPAHLRSKGWDIDDCNAYDQAEEALKTEKEKAEKRQRRGRSSIVFKAEAEKEKSRLIQEVEELNEELDVAIGELETRKDYIDKIESIRRADNEEIEAMKQDFKGLKKNKVELSLIDWNRVKELLLRGFELELDNNKLKKEIHNLRIDVAEKTKRISALVKENNVLSEEVAVLSAENIAKDHFLERHGLLEKFKDWFTTIKESVMRNLGKETITSNKTKAR